MLRPVLRIFLLAASLATALPERRDLNPTVTIDNGVVVGTATGVLNQPSVTGLVNAYLGVPFAKSPPVRFAPPEDPIDWSTPLQAQTLRPACLQNFLSGQPGVLTREYFDNPGLPPPAESEDCLYLNVFAPQDAGPENLKSVMFWLYGGNLAFGTASLAYYNGSSLAVNHDVVVVAINYRTNIFGFSNSPEIATGQQNSGYLDQRKALEWVQSNIRSFGGDPSRVTIFGESAGAYSVRDLLINPPSPLPYRAAIMESEAALCTIPGLVSYETVAAHFNCTTAPSTLSCLRAVDGLAIQSYLDSQSLSFCPAEDNVTHSANALPSLLSGSFADVPVLMGTNADEGRVFAAILGLDSAPSLFSYLSSIGLDFNPAQRSAIAVRYMQNATAAAAAAAAAAPNVGYLLAGRVITDLIFTCRARALSAAIARAGMQSVYRYLYSPAFPNTSPFADAGAYHSSEIPEAFGTFPLSNYLGDATEQQRGLSGYMQKAWTDFAKYPLEGVPWPKLTGFGVDDVLGNLGGEKSPEGEETQRLAESDASCAIYEPLLIAANFAY